MRIALAPDCRIAAGQNFVRINPPATIADAMAALRDLAAARAAARSGGALPFASTCADETGQGACAPGGRAVLANLRSNRRG